jgi:hypothetical protein
MKKTAFTSKRKSVKSLSGLILSYVRAPLKPDNEGEDENMHQ